MQEPPIAAVEHWRDGFGGSADGVAGGVGVGGRPTSPVTSEPWQVSALGLLGIIVIVSAIFLHLVAEAKWGGHSSSSSDHTHYHSPNHARRRQRQRARVYKERKKKTDEWSEDEEEDNHCNNEDADHTILVSLSGQDPPILTATDAAGSTMVVVDPSSTSGGIIMGCVGGASLSTTPSRSTTSSSAAGSGGMANVAASGRTAYPYYYQQSSTTPQAATHFHYGAPVPPPQQEHRHRKLSSNKEPSTPPPHMATTASYDYYNIPPSQPHSGMVPKYFSPSSKLSQRSPHPAGPTHISIKPAMTSLVPGGGTATAGGVATAQGRLRLATPPEPMELSGMMMVGTPTSGYSSSTSTTSGGPMSQQYHHQQQQQLQRLLPTPHEESQLLMPSVSTEARHGSTGLNSRLLSAGSDISSFNSFVEGSIGTESEELIRGDNGGEDGERTPHNNSSHQSSSLSYDPLSNTSQRRESHSSVGSGSRHHHSSLILTPGNGFDETPRVGNQRRMLAVDQLGSKLNKQQQPQQQHQQQQEPHISMRDRSNVHNNKDAKGNDDLDGLASFLKSDTPFIPFIPTLESSMHKLQQQHVSGRFSPPRSILMDELKLIQMETGSSMHWGRDESNNGGTPDVTSPTMSESFASEEGDSSSYASDISIPSGDPRKSIIHKRTNLTQATDSASSLQSSIQFSELQFEEVIGGGGFGQVWKATWRGTPVAVKVLTGSAQAKHIAKAVLEEFRAEINLLKGMRHPNICLYMGACVDPPNRAIITELAANGSAWDALRLPLMPPFVPCDGTARGAWPKKLYFPDQQHGMPPSAGSRGGAGDLSSLRLTAPIPPKGTWSWELVKRVACGAARGMAYLHSGNPPVLHRDLKSANLLLDDSYTTKVCDFGLSRLKAQERSMTGNCGTVQWMAPEVLANMSYNEKADVYSYGIICWELLTRECPYDGMSAIQCALAVLNRDKRPEIPKWCPPALHALIKACVKKEPTLRPTFAQIIQALDAMDK